MGVSIQIFIALSITIFGSILLARGRGRRSTLKYFFWGDNGLTTNQVTQLILSTSFSFNAILYHAWLGYAIGWSAVLIQVLWVASFIWVRKYSKEIITLKEHGTMHGSIEHFFGKKAGILAAWASIIGFALLIGWEVTVVTNVLASNFKENVSFYTYFLAGVICLIVGVYTIRGGIKGNLYANLFQNIIAFLALIALMIFLFWENGTPKTYSFSGSINQMVVALGVGGLITNIVFSLVWQFVDMSNWQNLASAGSVESVKKSLYRSALWVLVFPGVIGTAIGISMANVPDLNEAIILNKIISIVTNPIMLIITMTGFFAVMFSTLDGYLLSASQSMSWDILHRSKIKKMLEGLLDRKIEEKIMTSVFKIILMIAIVGGIGTLIVHKLGIELFHLVYIVTIAHLSLFPTVFILLINKKKKLNIKFNAFYSILSGLIVGFGFVVISLWVKDGAWLTWSATAGLFVAVLVGLLVGSSKRS